LEAVLKPTAVSQLWVIPSGGIASDFPVLIRSQRMHEAIQGLRERFELIIFDLPSVLTSTDLGVLPNWLEHRL
jgi:Mrp family chromosome partitioning ATPase